ncbi:hypothetical protein D3C72_987200 [compost metagenome]
MIGVYRLLQVRYRFIALSCLHGGQPFGFGAERRIGQLFLLSFQLRAGGGDVIARAEHLQIILERFYAAGADRQVFDLLIPDIRGRIAPGV